VKVTVDLDPRDLWVLTDQAEKQGMTLPDFLRARMLDRKATVQDRVVELHAAGMCDADIGAELNMTLQQTANMRRGMGLEPNRRYGNTRRSK
jgi:hypothetical protein